MSYIRYDMKYTKIIVRSIWDHPPLVIEKIAQGMRCDKILGKGRGNIREAVLDDFLPTSVLT